MRCIACQRFLSKSASPSMVIGPVCLKRAMPQPKRKPRAKGEGRAVVVLPGQMRLELEGENLTSSPMGVLA